MDAVYDWVENIVCFYIFITMILQILPKESYRKYIRFFTGLLLVIVVMTPLLNVLGKEETLSKEISRISFFQELDNRKLDTKHLEEAQKEVFLKEYETSIGVDISQMAQARGLDTQQVEVVLTKEYQLEEIKLVVSFQGNQGLHLKKAVFSEEEKEYPSVQQLKQELMDAYQITKEQIEINVQGGME
ncbi:MAG: stage III sporulation protein AF [Lachnospiraceae bacterium]